MGWARKQGLRLAVGVHLTLDTDDVRTEPQPSHSVLGLALGETRGELASDRIVQLADGHSFGGGSQLAHHDGLHRVVQLGVLSFHSFALVQLSGQLVPNSFGFGSVDGGDEGQDGVHGGFLHGVYLSGL